MDIPEKELEERLFEAGNNFLKPSTSIDELLVSLDLVEHLLGGVEQSPSDSMKKALVPSTKALVAEELLTHSNPDVKVAVASCISEITRITAPEAPYGDEKMKELFQLIVSSFEKLDDKSSPSYRRKISILETVAKVRSCVVMLDLECDELILEMFRHFFRTIREDHEDVVFTSMETIMTLVVEESEDISRDLLLSILNALKKESKEALPIACQLGEKVIVNCAAKLKPYLLPAVRSNGASLDDYSKVVADACQAGDEAIEPSDGDATNKNVADENNLVNTPSETAVEVAMETLEEAPLSEEVATTVGSPKAAMSNGGLENSNDNTYVANDNSKEAVVDIQDYKAEPNETIAVSVSSKEPSKTQPEKATKMSESIDNFKEAGLDTQEGICFEEPPKSETKPEINNVSQVNDDSMEVDLDRRDVKAEPCETIADSVVTEEPLRSEFKPNNSKEVELDTQIEKTEPSETIADSVVPDELSKSKSKLETSNSVSAHDDNSNDADLDKQDDKAEPIEPVDKQDEKAEPSEMIVDKQDEKAEPSDMIVDKQDGKAEPSELIVDKQDEKAEPSDMTVDKQDGKAEPSEMHVDKQDEKAEPSKLRVNNQDEKPEPNSVDFKESPESNNKPEKSNSICVADDNSKAADSNTQDEKVEPNQTIVDSVGSDDPPKSKAKPGKSKKRKGKRSKSKKKSTKPFKPLVSDKTMDVVDVPEHQDNTRNAADNATQSEDPIDHSTEAADNEKLSEALISSPKTSDNERVATSPPSSNEIPANETRSKKAGVGKKKEGTIKDGEAASNVDTKHESDTESEKENTGSERKHKKGGTEKPSSQSDKELSVPDVTDDMAEDDCIDEFDGSSAQDLAQKTKLVGSQLNKKKKPVQVKATPAKPRRKTPAKDEKEENTGPPKSSTKVVQDESDMEEALKSSSKRKRPSGKKVPETKVYGGKDLVNATVEVWWPVDKSFYQGIVTSFDPAKKRHTVSYDDGDVEVLTLETENWRLINLSEAHAKDGDSPDESSDETPIGKRVKRDLESKQGKTMTGSSSKKSGASSSKSKATPKSGSKQAISKVSGKSKEEDKTGKSSKGSKSGNIAVADDTKSARKSKIDDTNTPKVSSKSKQDLSRGNTKSKGKTPKSVGKSGSAPGGKLKAADTPTNSDESEDELPEPERAPVKSKGKSQTTPKSKNSSKKRKRSGKN